MIADLIPKIAAMEAAEEEHEYFPRPSLSGPERCARQMVYWGLGVEKKPLPGRAQLVFDDSSWHEELTGDWLRKSAYRLHSEQMKVDAGERHGIKLKGRIDGILTDINEVDRHLEHKAISHFIFQRCWKGELPLDNIAQTCLYNAGLQKINPDIRESILLLKNKNTAQYMEFLIHYQEDEAWIFERGNSQGERIEMDERIPNVVEDAFRKFADVRDHIAAKTLPKRQYDMDHWRCSYCLWAETCWANWAKELRELRTEALLPQEIAEMAKGCKEMGSHRLLIEKEEKELKGRIGDAMKEAGVREGRAGEWAVELKLMEKPYLDKEFIPAETLKRATRTSRYEQLFIRKIKGTGEGSR